MGAPDASGQDAAGFTVALVAGALGRVVANLLGATGDVAVVGVQELARLKPKLFSWPPVVVGGYLFWGESSALCKAFHKAEKFASDRHASDQRGGWNDYLMR